MCKSVTECMRGIVQIGEGVRGFEGGGVDKICNPDLGGGA